LIRKIARLIVSRIILDTLEGLVDNADLAKILDVDNKGKMVGVVKR